MNLLARIARPFVALFGARAFEGASQSSRWASVPGTASLNADILAGHRPLAMRATNFAINDPYAARAENVLVSNIGGDGFKIEAVGAAAKGAVKRFATWCARCDAERRLIFAALQALAIRMMVREGEAFLWMQVSPRGELALRLIAKDQVDATINRDLAGGGYVRAGLEFTVSGEPAAFWILPSRPGDLAALPMTPIRVPAADVIHLFNPIAVGQVRGVSWFAPVLLMLNERGQLDDALLVKAKIAAMLAGIVVSPDGTTGPFQGTPAGGIMESGLEPGTLKMMPPGSDLKLVTPPQVGDTIEFLVKVLRAIAAGLNVTYEQISGDMTGVNYSSARVALIEHRRFVTAMQHNLVIPRLCQPIWSRWVRLEMLAGRLPMLAADAIDEAYAVKFLPPGWDWVDPLKDAQAEREAVAAGFKSRREVVAERGYDVEEIDAELAADAKRAKALGLQFGQAAAKPAQEAPADVA